MLLSDRYLLGLSQYSVDWCKWDTHKILNKVSVTNLTVQSFVFPVLCVNACFLNTMSKHNDE